MADIRELDERTQQQLVSIQNKDINDLTEVDKAFLRARRDYLGRNARNKYADILGAKPVEVEAQDKGNEEPINPHPGDTQPVDEEESDGEDEE